MRKKPLRILATLILLVSLVPFTAGQASQPSASPTPSPQTDPSEEGPLGGRENLPNPAFSQLYGDLPSGSNWYNPPLSAFFPTSAGTLALKIIQVAAGLSHTCVLTEAGGIKCWGDNFEGKLGNGTIIDSFVPTDVVGLQSGVVAISASYKHTCALLNTGGMKCWGRNWHGELGDGTTNYAVEPVDVVGLSSGVKAISAGGFHTCALLDTGGVKCWGANWHGQLGNDTKDESHVPVDVVNLGSPAVFIATGKYHTCAIIDAGFTKCWGYNMYGQLGINSYEDKAVPNKVLNLKGIAVAIHGGEFHTCALTSLGSVMCWGDNSQGQVGDGSGMTWPYPTTVPGLESGVTDIQVGEFHNCARMQDGTLKCWGKNWAGQLGDGTQIMRPTPTDTLSLGGKVLSFSTGDSHTCAILDTNQLNCWGSNSFGQIGDGTSALHLQPVDVYGLTQGIKAIASGAMHTCALTDSGTVKCWGSNEFGQLGDGTNVSSLVPLDVKGLDEGVTAIAAGDFHTCAAIGNEVRCWGYNGYGQVGDGSRVNRNTPQVVSGISSPVTVLALGSNHSCALLQDATVIKCWGRGNNGQLGYGGKDDFAGAVRVKNLDGLGFSSLSAGERHTCASTLNGAVKCWGFNGTGQLGNGTSVMSTLPVDVLNINSEAARVISGESHNCALLFTGGIRCWGDNTYSQLGDGSFTQQWVPIDIPGFSSGVVDLTAGAFHTCVQLNTGQVMCWGLNQMGQLGDGTTLLRATAMGVSGLTDTVASLEAGSYETCALSSAGGIKCWGTNANGQVGDGSVPWQLTPLAVRNLLVPNAAINFQSGQPGSFFAVTAVNLTPNVTAVISVNGVLLSPDLTTDAGGNLAFQLDTTDADPGSYTLTLDADDRFNLVFTLSSNAPLRAQTGSGPVYQLPSGITLTPSAYIPLCVK